MHIFLSLNYCAEYFRGLKSIKMKKKWCIILLFFAISAKAQLVLITVGDKMNLKPIENARVFHENHLYLTDANGELALTLTGVSDTIIVKCMGYMKQSFVISKGEKNLRFFLEKNILPLKEVVIETYKAEKLCELMLKAFNKALALNKPSKAYIETYSFGEELKPIEYIKGFYNINFAAGKITTLKLKIGQLIFPYEELENNFLSYSNSVVLQKSNPFAISKDTQFISPFFFKQKIVLQKYHLSFKKVDDSLLLIICKSKKSNYSTAVLLNKYTLALEEIQNTWLYNDYYPLVSINSKKTLSDSMVITSILYFKKNKFLAQNLKMKFLYDGANINTLTSLRLLEEDMFYEPNNDLDFNNDYYDIVSKPKYPEALTTKLFNFTDSTKSISKAFKQDLIDKKLILFSKFDARLFEFFTKIAIPENDFNFDWSQIPLSSKDHDVMKSGLKTYIFSDFICFNDSVYYNVKPYIDYSLSQFSYERTPLAEHYLKNFYYITKIYSDSLLTMLDKKLKKCPSNIEFDKLVKDTNRALEKTLWKYYFEVNAGENRAALNRWDEFILSKLVF